MKVHQLVFSIIIFILLLSNVSDSIINTAKFNGYALIGSNSNSRMAFATLLSKGNKTLAFSSTNKYEIIQIFNEPSRSFGSCVGLGSATSNDKNITIGVIGDSTSSSGMIYVYNIESCVENSLKNSSKCDYLFIQESVKEKDDFQCTIGTTIAVGPNFIVSSCQNNLLSSKTKSSPISVCILDLDNSPNNCSKVLYLDKPPWKPCTGGKGQMYTTALEVYENKIIVGLCGICMSPNKLQIQIEYTSAFVIIQIVNDTLVTDYIAQPTSRTESCPSIITFNNDWVVIGYSEEEMVDLYYRNLTTPHNGSTTSSTSSSNSDSSSGSDGSDSKFNHPTSFFDNATLYTLFDTIYQPNAIGYGVDIAISSTMLLVSSTGDPNQNITGNVFFYEIFTDNSSYPVRTNSKAMVPNLNYQTTFNYQYGISFFGTEVMVVSQDSTGKKMGFDFYAICSAGAEWSSEYEKCMICHAGQYKSVSSIHVDNSSFELCSLCPHGYYSTDYVFGLSSIEECSNNLINVCQNTEFCPDGTIYPLNNIPVQTNSQTFPDLDESEQLDFESTFYNSCYPYFLIIMGIMITVTLAICLPWPRKHQARQKRIMDLLFMINFYSWDEEENFEEVEYSEHANPESNNITSLSSSSGGTFKRGIFVRRKRMAVKPVKAVETFCTYYFLVVLVLMIIFIIQFQRINSDISTELRSLGQASAVLQIGQDYTDAQYLKFVDTSSMLITIDLYGYTGNCSNNELKLVVNGCQNKNYMGNCKFATQLESITLIDNINFETNTASQQSNTTCRITTSIGFGMEYSDITDFYFDITPIQSYFYAQRIIYNVSTNNNGSSINTGNSYVTGVVQPLEGTILRESATVSILSMMTMISDCKIKSDDKGLSLIRPMTEKCLYDPQSYKEFSFISNSTSYLNSQEYHNVNPTFQFNLHFEKSVFYHYVMSSHSISFGQIITVILFAVLDVFWLIEVVVPLIQVIVGFFEGYLKTRKDKQSGSGEYYDSISNELEGIINKSDSSSSKKDQLLFKNSNSNSFRGYGTNNM